MIPRLTLALIAVALVVLITGIPVTADNSWSGTEGPTPPGGFVSIESRLDPAHMPSGWDIPCQGECIPIIMVFSPGDKIEFHGENTATDMTYLFISGPGLPENGAQINKPDPAHSPVEPGNPATFARTSIGSDHTWSWTWDTTGTVLKDGTYEILASSLPNGFDRSEAARGYFKLTFKNPSTEAATTKSTTVATTTATATPTITKTVMPGVVTIVTASNQNYFLGDEINFTGTNTAALKTYLFITGPGLAINGSQIHVPNPKNAPVINDNPITFKQMDVQGNHTWSWRWGTANTNLDAGTYTVYAAAGPNDKDNLEKIPHGTVSIVIKKPLVSATASPAVPIKTQSPAESPGYGALITLIGLGAVAFIAIRRH